MPPKRRPKAKPKLEFPVLSPDLQIDFWARLQNVRERHLGPSLAAAVDELEIADLDQELGRLADPGCLRRIAKWGLRGEVLLPVPCILVQRPHLLGYYRLLYGLSQKEFYSKGPFTGALKRMEEDGIVTEAAQGQLPAACASLMQTGQQLVEGLPHLSLDIVRELQLLTLGAQFRGSRNTELGQAATVEVFEFIKRLLQPNITHSTNRTITLENAAGRTIVVEFSSDPDIRFTEALETGVFPLVSVEIKGGTDRSNVHNRIGEAEKSHQKARLAGFHQFWTILAAEVDPQVARDESPTTTHFFHLPNIGRPDHQEHRQFRDILASTVGVRISARGRRRNIRD